MNDETTDLEPTAETESNDGEGGKHNVVTDQFGHIGHAKTDEWEHHLFDKYPQHRNELRANHEARKKEAGIVDDNQEEGA